MSDEQDKQSIQDGILKAIAAGKVKMVPKWHFVLKTILFITGVVLTALALLYLASFIVFMLHQDGVWFLPAFGLAGLREMLTTLPWLFILLALLFVVLLEILVRHYSFAYRRPLIVSLGGTLLFVIVGSIVVAQTGFHEGLFNRARENHLPFAGPLYHRFGMRGPQNVALGRILEKNQRGYQIETPNGEIITVIIIPQTHLLPGTNFAEGDIVVVLGQRENNTIEARNIRQATGRMPPLRNRPYH